MRLLLHCGASIDNFDRERNSPLHTLASTFPAFRTNVNEMIAKAEEITTMFINAGIHLDAVNTDGSTAAKSSSLRKLNIIFKGP